jgi:hypothetical protein
VLVLGGRIVGPDLALEIVSTWLDTGFEGGRHNRRIKKIDQDRLETVVYKVVSRYFDKIESVNISSLEKSIGEALDMVLKKNQEKESKKER